MRSALLLAVALGGCNSGNECVDLGSRVLDVAVDGGATAGQCAACPGLYMNLLRTKCEPIANDGGAAVLRCTYANLCS